MTELSERIWKYLDDDALRRVQTYYRVYPGRSFETLAGGGSREETRDCFVADDIVAVALLGVNIPSRAILQLLDEKSRMLTGLLHEIPVDLNLWEADRVAIGPESPADKLWRKLEAINGIGWMTAGKLMARKRPQLIPVFDRVVKAALLPTQSDTWWVSLWDALQDEAVVARLISLKEDARLPEPVSLLRVLDVAVWMASQVPGEM